MDALGKLSEEDPTFRFRIDEETGQTVMSGMGELHLEIIVERLKKGILRGDQPGKAPGGLPGDHPQEGAARRDLPEGTGRVSSTLPASRSSFPLFPGEPATGLWTAAKTPISPPSSCTPSGRASKRPPPAGSSWDTRSSTWSRPCWMSGSTSFTPTTWPFGSLPPWPSEMPVSRQNRSCWNRS